jgi:hypothetical protein
VPDARGGAAAYEVVAAARTTPVMNVKRMLIRLERYVRNDLDEGGRGEEHEDSLGLQFP